MERTFDQDERIRRAQEIYARRQNLRERTKRATVNVSEPKNFKLFKKLALQIIICTLIYYIFYLINTTNYSFSEQTLSKTKEMLSTDLDFYGIYNTCIEEINKYLYTTNNIDEPKEESQEKPVEEQSGELSEENNEKRRRK